MAYRIFKREWEPEPGPKRYVRCTVETQEEARAECRRRGLAAFGDTMRGPRGLAYEYEEV